MDARGPRWTHASLRSRRVAPDGVPHLPHRTHSSQARNRPACQLAPRAAGLAPRRSGGECATPSAEAAGAAAGESAEGGVSVVGVVGLGASGLAAAALAYRSGAREVRLFDTNVQLDVQDAVARVREYHEGEGQADDEFDSGRIQLYAGPHDKYEDALQGCDIVVLSPGVPYARVPVLAQLVKSGRAVSEIAFAADFLEDVRCALITGTNGKSTTTAFTAGLLAAAFDVPPNSVFAGGNLGTPLSKLALQSEMSPCIAAAVECSSYQLEPNDLANVMQVDAAVLTTFTPDHLARHGTLRAYADAKVNALRCLSPKGSVLLPGECADAFRGALSNAIESHDDDASTVLGHAAAALGDDMESRVAFVRYGTDEIAASISAHEDDATLCGAYVSTLTPRCRLRLPCWAAGAHVDFDLSTLPCVGVHNRFDAACALFAVLATCSTNAPPDDAMYERLAKALATLVPPPHRLQRVGTPAGESMRVIFIDDSKATNVESTLAALDSLAGDGVTCACLLGGEAKRAADGTLGMGALAGTIHLRHLPAICFGADGATIASELVDAAPQGDATRVVGGVFSTMEEAVEAAYIAACEAMGTSETQGSDRTIAVLLSPACASFDAFDNFEHRGREFKKVATRLMS